MHTRGVRTRLALDLHVVQSQIRCPSEYLDDVVGYTGSVPCAGISFLDYLSIDDLGHDPCAWFMVYNLAF